MIAICFYDSIDNELVYVWVMAWLWTWHKTLHKPKLKPQSNTTIVAAPALIGPSLCTHVATLAHTDLTLCTFVVMYPCGCTCNKRIPNYVPLWSHIMHFCGCTSTYRSHICTIIIAPAVTYLISYSIVVALAAIDLTVYPFEVATLRGNLISYIAVTQVPTYITSCTSVAALVPTDLIVCISVTTPITHYVSLWPTDFTKCAIEPRDAAALEGSSGYGIIATAVVLTRHRHTLVNVWNNTDELENITLNMVGYIIMSCKSMCFI